MTESEVFSGICGFSTLVQATMAGERCALTITSDCQSIQQLADVLTQVDPLREISFRGEVPTTHEMAAKYCQHAACPVPVGIIKAVEVEAGLALPADAAIRVSKSTQ